MPRRIFVTRGPGLRNHSILRNVAAHRDLNCVYAIQSTTRAPREPDEHEGIHHWFLSTEHFLYKLERGWFLDYAKEGSGPECAYYGTMKYQIDDALTKGKSAIICPETLDGHIIRHHWPDAITIFIASPHAPLREQCDPKAYDLAMTHLKTAKTVRQIYRFLRSQLAAENAPDISAIAAE